MDDYFSDDGGLDDLNDKALQELEKNAIQFTQFTQAHHRPDPTQLPDPNFVVDSRDFEDDDLDDAVLIDELAPQQKPLPSQQPHISPAALARQRSWNQLPRPPRSSRQPALQGPSAPYRPPYANPPQAGPTRPYPLPSQRYPPARAIPPPPPYRLDPSSRSPAARTPAPPALANRYAAQLSQALRSTVSVGQEQTDFVGALQARLRVLETELLSAKGEVSIVRGKYDKSLANHETELARLKKQNAEQIARQERMVEAALAAERKAATELQFLKQDLKEEVEKAKKGRKDGVPGTPSKKIKSWGVSDGFDDVEILPSPSKGQGRRIKDAGAIAMPVAERTPTKGKRKRPAIDSPVTALETEDVVMFDDVAPATSDRIDDARRSQLDPLPFDFLMLVLDHSSFHGRPLTFDLFARYSFPSDPSQTFAAMIFQKLPSMGSPHDPMRLLVDFARLVLEIWSRCLREEYHQPIYDLAALVSFILGLDTVSVAPQIINEMVSVVHTTIYLVAVPRFNSLDGDISSHSDPVVRQLYLEIDTESCFSLLYLAALGCVSYLPGPQEPGIPGPPPHDAQVQFWKLIRLEFVLLMLAYKQPPSDFFAIRALLCTSALPDSIGPITGDESQDPAFVANLLIDRVSVCLVDLPRWAEPRNERYKVQLAALQTLVAFACSGFGLVKLAESTVATPRLVATLCAAIDALYDLDAPILLLPDIGADTCSKEVQVEPPPAGSGRDQQDPNRTQEDLVHDGSRAQRVDEGIEVNAENSEGAGEEDTAPLLLQMISQAMLLLHTIVTDPRTANRVNVQSKLATLHGGAQRYLLTLARLNFAEEDLVLEAGIDADTVERAHELLELAATPDEGESMGEVFGF